MDDDRAEADAHRAETGAAFAARLDAYVDGSCFLVDGVTTVRE